MNILKYYVDGACSGNPGPGGFGVIRIGKRYENGSTFLSIEDKYNEFCAETTNNREELKAILFILWKAVGDPNNSYEIYSDSAYAVNACNQWLWAWVKNGWRRSKNQPIENLDIIQEIYKLLSKNPPLNVKIIKCSGHSGVLENELADALASGNNAKFNKLIRENNIDM